MTLLFAVLSSAIFGVGVALQQRPARAVPQQHSARPMLLLTLVRRPIWVLGVVAEIAGFVLQVLALRTGSLVVVQPVLTVSLLFTIGLTALWSEATISATEWVAVAAVVVGLSVFMILASPRSTGGANASPADWLATMLGLGAGVAALVVAGRRRLGQARAMLFGAAAGVSDAAMAVVTKAFAHDVDLGFSHVITSWTPYTLVGAGLVAMTVSQSAYQAGHPTISLPIITVADPVISSAVGVALFGEVVHLDNATAPAAVAAIAVMVVGLVILSRSHHVGEGAKAEPAAEPASTVER